MAKSNKQASKDNRPKKKQVEKSGKSEDNKINPQVTVAIIGGIVTVVIALFSFPPFVRLFEPTETPTASIISTQVIPMESSATSVDIPTPTSTSLPPLIVDKVSKEMVLIPAGDFIMGSDTGDPNESPSHVVHLDTFYIDRTEVTNTEYRACVQEKMCQPPLSLSSRTRQKYYGDKRFDNYPVVNVDWGMAKAYCEWRGARLPTEAEWEKAARGENGFTYPWGDAFSCSKGNFDDEQKIDDYFVPGGPDCDGFPDTAPVGSYSAGASPYGVLDMSGNVWEWVNSMANPYPYNENDGRESPGSSSMRSIKGGAFTANDYYSRSSNRRQDSPAASNDNTGIRCARSVEP